MIYVVKLVTWLLEVFRRERFDIGRWGPAGKESDYLIRWTLLGRRSQGDWRCFLHFFWRGDREDYLHDHPWPFTSVILWGGYWEWTPFPRGMFTGPTVFEMGGELYKRIWYGPGSILRRPAAWRHRVELPPGKFAWTLVFAGKKQRSWGFWCPQGFLPWRQHEANVLAGAPGCGD